MMPDPPGGGQGFDLGQQAAIIVSIYGGDSAMVVTGGCLCRAIRYEFAAAPIVTRVCWCRVCQFIGAGSGTVNACFPTAALTLHGSLREYKNVAESGNLMSRRFCPHCGTPLFSEAQSRPHLVFVRAGTLDDPELAQPASSIWTSQAPSWACINSALPRVERQPPPAA
jgi:hypothetical protein